MSDFPLTSINLLIAFWLVPGLIISATLIKKDSYGVILIPIFGTGFWSLCFSFTNLQNFSAFKDLSLIIYFLYILTLIIVSLRKRGMVFGYLGIILLVNLVEVFNYHYGLINPSGSSMNILRSLYNMEYSALYEFGAPQVYIVALSFFFIGTSSILLSVSFLTGVAAFLLSGILLYKIFEVDKRIFLLAFIFPIFNFEVTSWMLRVRPHFLASGLTLLFISSCYFYKRNKDLDSKIIIFTSLFLIMNTRTESVILFSLFVLIIFTLEINNLFLTKFSVIFFLVTYVSTLEGFLKYEGIRGPYFTLLIYILFYLVLLAGDRSIKIHELIMKRFNFILSLFIGLIFLICIYLYGDLALQSYRVLFVKLSDPGTSFGSVFILYFGLLLTLCSDGDSDVRRIIVSLYLIILFVFLTAPLQHSVFGWETFYTEYVGQDSLIYNPFDESQSRSIMQFYLTIGPLIACYIFKNTKKTVLTKKTGQL